MMFETTKVGAGDKDRAFVVKEKQGMMIGLVTLVVIALLGSLAVDYRSGSLTLTVQQDKLYQSKETQIKEKHDAQTKLTQVYAMLQAHLMRERDEKEQIHLMKRRHKHAIAHTRSEITELFAPYAADQDKAQAVKFELLQEEVLMRFDEFYSEMRTITDEHTHRLVEFANVADEVLRKTTKDFTSEMRAEAAQHATEYDGEAPAPAGDDTEAEDDSLRSLLDHFESKMQGMGGVPLDPETLKLWQDTLEGIQHGSIKWSEGEQKMKDLMAAPSHGPLKVVTKEGNSVLENFQEMLKELQFLPHKRALLEQITLWKTKAINREELMLYLEREIEAQNLDPNWLIDEEQYGHEEPSAPESFPDDMYEGEEMAAEQLQHEDPH